MQMRYEQEAIASSYDSLSRSKTSLFQSRPRSAQLFLPFRTNKFQSGTICRRLSPTFRAHHAPWNVNFLITPPRKPTIPISLLTSNQSNRFFHFFRADPSISHYFSLVSPRVHASETIDRPTRSIRTSTMLSYRNEFDRSNIGSLDNFI